MDVYVCVWSNQKLPKVPCQSVVAFGGDVGSTFPTAPLVEPVSAVRSIEKFGKNPEVAFTMWPN